MKSKPEPTEPVWVRITHPDPLIQRMCEFECGGPAWINKITRETVVSHDDPNKRPKAVPA